MKARFVLLFLLAILVVVGAWTQKANILLLTGVVAPEPNLPDHLFTSKEAVRWSLQPWTGDDAPYKAIRKEIDDETAKGANRDQLRKEAWIEAEKNPHDPELQFRWAYSAWKTISDNAPPAKPPASDFIRDLQTTHLITYQLSRATDPKTYNYARLLYLSLPDDSYNLTTFGERLLRQDTTDRNVKYHLVGDYAGQVSLNGFHTKRVNKVLQGRALKLAYQLIASSPKNDTYWTTLGMVYLGATDINHSSSDAKKGIVAYQKYLQLAPADDEFRPQAETMIKQLQYQADMIRK